MKTVSIISLVKAFIVSLLFILLDYFWHLWFTTPMETTGYFLLKFIMSIVLATILFNINYGYGIIVLFGVLQSVFISVYYRFYELFGDLPFGYRAPNIKSNLLGGEITVLFLKGIIWFTFHAGAWIIAFVIVDFVSDKLRLR